MQVYQTKNLKYGFVILCPNRSLSLLKTTVGSIEARHPGASFIAVADSEANAEDMAALKEVCPTYKGKSTITSLINVGIRHSSAEWVFVVFSGTTVRWQMDQKFGYFIDSDKDILYPIAERKYNFLDATLNGLFINRRFFKEVGEFEEEGELELVKMIWAEKAMSKGCRFKAIIGTKLC